jgi:hypothetical protein
MIAEQPQLPTTCEVVGLIRDTSDVSSLTQDMLEVYFPNTDILIRAGWYPDEDLSGSYFVSVYQAGERIRGPYKSTHISEIKSVIERYASAFSRPYQTSVSSDSVITTEIGGEPTFSCWKNSSQLESLTLENLNA